MRIVFWTPVYEKLGDYVKTNRSIQDLSEEYPFVFACSGGSQEFVTRYCGKRSLIIETLANKMTTKAYLVQQMLKFGVEKRFDFLVKVDLDAILFDVEQLKTLLKPYLGQKVLIGNRNLNARKAHHFYIRGGVQAISFSALQEIVIDPTTPKQHQLDTAFSKSVSALPGGELVELPLFEQSVKYSGSLPGWHPIKSKPRWEQFVEANEEYLGRIPEEEQVVLSHYKELSTLKEQVLQIQKPQLIFDSVYSNSSIEAPNKLAKDEKPFLWYHDALVSSQLFDIDYADFGIELAPYSCLLQCNGENIIFDAGDIARRFLKQNPFEQLREREVKLGIVVQRSSSEKWQMIEREYLKAPIVPFSMYPSRGTPLGHFRYDVDEEKDFVGLLSGRQKWGREEWGAFVEKEEDFSVGKYSSSRVFREELKKAKWGIVLEGYGNTMTDPKNRRVPEFTSCGIPLALNYQPCYPFPFEPNKDYILLEKPEDLLKLRTIDPAPFVEASKCLWEQYFSPQGVASLFMKLMQLYEIV